MKMSSQVCLSRGDSTVYATATVTAHGQTYLQTDMGQCDYNHHPDISRHPHDMPGTGYDAGHPVDSFYCGGQYGPEGLIHALPSGACAQGLVPGYYGFPGQQPAYIPLEAYSPDHPYGPDHADLHCRGYILGPNGKPKRKRVATVAQRRAANIRERRRMFNLNEAFDVLRKKVPTFAYEKRLSRIETLRLAITYISFMTDIVKGKEPDDIKLSALKGAAMAALKRASGADDSLDEDMPDSPQEASRST